MFDVGNRVKPLCKNESNLIGTVVAVAKDNSRRVRVKWDGICNPLQYSWPVNELEIVLEIVFLRVV